MREETLEEDFESYALAEKLFKQIYGYEPEIIAGNLQHEIIVAVLQKGMVYGAQQERIYSEEVLKKCWDASSAYTIATHEDFKQTHPNFIEWFEQFKKK